MPCYTHFQVVILLWIAALSLYILQYLITVLYVVSRILTSTATCVYMYVHIRSCAHMALKSRGISAVDANRIRKLNKTYL